MKKSTKKQPAKKRGRPAKHEITLHNYELTPVIHTKKDTEIEALAAVISIFDNWDEDQKTRNIRFLASKYWEYLNNGAKI